MNIVIIGSVNVGKSTLSASLLIGSKAVQKRQFIQNKASIMDINEEEKISGNTYEYNKEIFNYNGKEYTILDTPGHKNRISEMIIASSKANLAIVILSARKGEYATSLKGNVLEYIMICKAMGITSIIIAVNKMETVDFDEDIFNYIKNDFSARIKQYRFDSTVYVPISAEKVLNIFDKHDEKIVTDSLINTIDKLRTSHRTIKKIQPVNHIIYARVIFNDITSVITIGFKCMMHSLDNILDVSIIDIKNHGCKYITYKNSRKKIIDIILKLDTNEKLYNRIILRSGNYTIGYGLIQENP